MKGKTPLATCRNRSSLLRGLGAACLMLRRRTKRRRCIACKSSDGSILRPQSQKLWRSRIHCQAATNMTLTDRRGEFSKMNLQHDLSRVPTRSQLRRIHNSQKMPQCSHPRSPKKKMLRMSPVCRSKHSRSRSHQSCPLQFRTSFHLKSYKAQRMLPLLF